MANPGHAITLACKNHFGELKDCVVGRGKPPVSRKFVKLCVFEIAFHYGAEIVQLFVARLMRLYALVFQ
jgi:hypothetical protein